MRKFLPALFLPLLLLAAARAEVDIVRENYVANKDTGYCVWCSLKTLMQHHGMRSVSSRIIEDEVRMGGPRPGRAGVDKVRARLSWYVSQGHNLQYKIQEPGNKDLTIVRDAIRRKLGCVVTTRSGAHAVTLVDITNEKREWAAGARRFKDYTVRYIDSNDVMNGRRVVREFSLDWFVKHEWDGTVYVVEPRRNLTKSPKLPNKPVVKLPRPRRHPVAPVVQPVAVPPEALGSPQTRPELRPGKSLAPLETLPRAQIIIAVPPAALPRSKLTEPRD